MAEVAPKPIIPYALPRGVRACEVADRQKISARLREASPLLEKILDMGTLVRQREGRYEQWGIQRDIEPELVVRSGHELLLTIQCKEQPDHFIRFVRRAETFTERLGFWSNGAQWDYWRTASEQAHLYKQVKILGIKFSIPQGGVSKDLWI